jgi:hypothetical protein
MYEIDIEVLESNPHIISAQQIAHKVTLVTSLSGYTSSCGNCGANQLAADSSFRHCKDCGTIFKWIALSSLLESIEQDGARLMANMPGIGHLKFVGYSTGLRALHSGLKYAYFGQMVSL